LLRGSCTRQGGPAAEAILQSILRLAAAEAATPGLLSDEIATAAEAVAKVYQDLSQHEQALDYYCQALEAREETLGETNTKTLNTLENIAENFAIQAKYDEALPYYEECLGRKEKVVALGREHPSVLATTTKIGRMHHKLCHMDEALQRFRDVLEIYRRTIGGRHPSYFAVLSDVAAIHQKQGLLNEALSEYREVLEGREGRYGPNHDLTRETRQAIEAIQSHLNNGDVQGKQVKHARQCVKYEKRELLTITRIGTTDEPDIGLVPLHISPEGTGPRKREPDYTRDNV
jgi:tetratricopeptide (TPR) repeat protein